MKSLFVYFDVALYLENKVLLLALLQNFKASICQICFNLVLRDSYL